MAEKIGHVIANYDIDNRRSGYGRGSDDTFFPDIERLDGEKMKDRQPARRTPFSGPKNWLFTGLVGIALVMFIGRRLKIL